MIKKVFPLIAVVFLTSSCSIYHVSSTNTSDHYYPTNENGEIAYLETIDDGYEVIGEVIVNAERRQAMPEVIQRIKREAAVLGGEAITNLKSDATGAWKRLPAQELIGNAYVRANFSASVVVSKQ